MSNFDTCRCSVSLILSKRILLCFSQLKIIVFQTNIKFWQSFFKEWMQYEIWFIKEFYFSILSVFGWVWRGNQEKLIFSNCLRVLDCFTGLFGILRKRLALMATSARVPKSSYLGLSCYRHSADKVLRLTHVSSMNKAFQIYRKINKWDPL